MIGFVKKFTSRIAFILALGVFAFPSVSQVSDVSETIAKAEKGDVEAELKLGMMYEDGRIVKQDNERAAYWYRKAAEQGNSKAQSKLGLMYHEGFGVPQDYSEALKWFRKSAEKGSADGQCGLGAMYYTGHGVPRDYTQALAWWRKAAEQDSETAQFNLAEMYRDGEGIPKDDVEAYKWYSLSAAHGFKMALKERDDLEQHMTEDQIKEAKRRAAQFIVHKSRNAKSLKD